MIPLPTSRLQPANFGRFATYEALPLEAVGRPSGIAEVRTGSLGQIALVEDALVERLVAGEGVSIPDFPFTDGFGVYALRIPSVHESWAPALENCSNGRPDQIVTFCAEARGRVEQALRGATQRFASKRRYPGDEPEDAIMYALADL